MNNLLKKILGTTESEADARHDVKMATSALLLEMAASDGDCSAQEQQLIVDILQDKFGLSSADAAELLEMAEAERQTSIDLWHFTNEINVNFSKAEKLMVIEAIWQVIYADGRLDKYEDYLVHQLARLMRIDHEDMIAAKLKVRDAQGSLP